MLSQPKGPRLTLAETVTTTTQQLPNRYILHAVEGFGKTSFGAQMPKPIFIQSRGETGLETLMDAGQLPAIAHTPEITNWDDLLYTIQQLRDEEHQFKTVVIDTVNGLERLCHEKVCERDFAGDWTERGFMGYMRGYEVSLTDWRQLLTALDELRTKRKIVLILLCHTKVKTFKNPSGADYDRYQPDMHEKTWSITHKWADVVLFGNFETTVITSKGGDAATNAMKKGKAAGGQDRILYTTRHASYDAKNRIGLEEEIEMGKSAVEGYQNFVKAVKAGREKGLGGVSNG